MKPVLLALWLLLQGAFAIDLNQLQSLERLDLQSAGQYNVLTMAFSADGQRLATVAPGYFKPAQVSLWDIASGHRIWQTAFTVDNDKTISALRFTSDKWLEVETRLNSNYGQPDVRYRANLELRNGKPVGAAQRSPKSLNQRLSEKLKIKLETLGASDASQNLIAYARIVNDTAAIVLLDATTFSEIGQLEELHGGVTALKFSPDGTQLAAARSDGRISLWDVTNRRKRYNLRGQQNWAQLEWSADSKRLLSFSEALAIVWNAETGAQLSRFASSAGRSLASATLEPAGGRIALSFAEGGMALMRSADSVITQYIGFTVAYSVFSRDAARLCVISSDSRLRVYRRGRNGYELRDEVLLEWSVTMPPLLSANRLILPSFNFGASVYTLDTRLVKQYQTPTIGDGNGNYIFTMLEPDHAWINGFLLDLNTGVVSDIRFINSNGSSPRPDLGKLLYSNESALVLSDLTEGNDTPFWTRPWINVNPNVNLRLPTWSPSGALLVAPWLEDKIIVLDARTGKIKSLIAAPYSGPSSSKPAIEELTVSPDDKLLIARYSSSTWRYFSLETRRELPAPPALQTALEAQFTPDGRALMTTTLDGLEFWGVPGKNTFVR